MVKRGEVYWVNLDPTVGTEIKKTRPCLIVSPDDLNATLPRVIVAPLTSKGRHWVVALKLTLQVKKPEFC